MDEQARAYLRALLNIAMNTEAWEHFRFAARTDIDVQLFINTLLDFLSMDSEYQVMGTDRFGRMVSMSPDKKLQATFGRCGGTANRAWRHFVLAAEGDPGTTEFIRLLLDFLSAEGTSEHLNLIPAAASRYQLVPKTLHKSQPGTSKASLSAAVRPIRPFGPQLPLPRQSVVRPNVPFGQQQQLPPPRQLSQFRFSAVHSQPLVTCRQQQQQESAGHFAEHLPFSDAFPFHAKPNTSEEDHIYHTVMTTTSSGSQRSSVIYAVPPITSKISRESVTTPPPHKNRKKNDETPSPASKCSDTKKRKETPKKDNDGKK
ncbi:hypothetical protein niasHS_014378 [Heterodera schachtii]|uniref:Uncharacterized protein n=1 Tax=Heterodera schachtii TaxID=97005 RepID=A0ABD2IFJ7_HETSC